MRAALRKGALVVLKAEQANLRAVMGHMVDGEQRASTGLLLKNLIVTRGKAPSDGKGERYLLRPKKGVFYTTSETGHARKGKAITTVRLNAARLEYGTSRQPAEPFIRPAVQAHGERALLTIQNELLAAIKRIVNKLAAQNRGK